MSRRDDLASSLIDAATILKTTGRIQKETQEALSVMLMDAAAVMTAWEFTPYRYSATVVSIYDADTLTLKVSLGFHITQILVFRLHGIDAWEVRGEERPLGIEARDWLRSQIKNGDEICIETYRDSKGKYGRYLADLRLKTDVGSYRLLNAELVDQGHAEWREY